MLNKIMQKLIFLTGVLATFCSFQLHAEHDVKDLKKLFTDRDQRAQIDAIRSGNYSDAEPKQVNKLNINGYMTRSSGKPVVWVNNKNTLDSSRIGDITVNRKTVGKNKKITVSVDGQTRHLKPGEIWYKDSGKIIDGQ